MRVNGIPAKPARDVNPGDSIETATKLVRILAISATRGPAPAARLLYDDLTPPTPPRTETRDRGAGRPTKRDRREIDRLRRR